MIAVLGTPLALALARHILPFERLIDTLVDLPLVLPPAVTGVALLMAFGRRGILGGFLSFAAHNIELSVSDGVITERTQ